MARKAYNVNASIGANSTVNVLEGTRFENVAANGLLLLAELAAATGINSELFVSDRNSKESSAVVVDADVNLKLPDDVVVDQVDAFVGERIQLNVANTTGSPIIYVARLILDDAVRMM